MWVTSSPLGEVLQLIAHQLIFHVEFFLEMGVQLAKSKTGQELERIGVEPMASTMPLLRSTN